MTAAAPRPPTSLEPGRKSWPVVALRIGISAAVLGLLFVFIPIGEVMAAVRRLSPTVWVLALVAYLGLHLIGVAKWRLLINAAGADLSFTQAARAYFAGLFGNTFLPSIVGGDVVRVAVAYRVTKSKAALILGGLIDRMLDFIGLATVAGIGALLVPRALDAQSRSIFTAVCSAILVACLCAALLALTVRPRRFGYKVRRKLARVRLAWRAVRRRPGIVATAFLSGIALQSLLVCLNSWLGARAGIEIPLYVWLFVWPLAKMSGIAPTQNGIGVREAAQVALFLPFGVPAELALATGLVFEVIILSGGLVAGLLAFLMGRFVSDQTKRRVGQGGTSDWESATRKRRSGIRSR